MRRARLGAGEGLCVVTREQTRGRGRQERVWISPRDAGLYFSVVLRPQFDVRVWPLITLTAALAVVDTLREAFELKTDIKWPNDILVDERKLCGILAETVETDTGLACVLGIGINLTDAVSETLPGTLAGRKGASPGSVPSELQALATSLATATGKAPNAERLLDALLLCLFQRYSQLAQPDGPAVVIRDWTAASSFAHGKRVRVTAATEQFEGTTRGLEDDGGLRVEADSGAITVVRAGDVESLRPVVEPHESL